jgi:hypothetical protein
MSGSGTSLFALCRDLSEARRVWRGLSDLRAEEPLPGEGAEGGQRTRLFVVQGLN